jgi:hypothetical protein
MRRRDFMTLVASATVAWPFGAGGQEAGRTYRLGILWPFPYGTPESSLLADALRPYGFIDGKNLNIDYRSWAQHIDQVWDYAAEFAKERVDAISAGGNSAGHRRASDLAGPCRQGDRVRRPDVALWGKADIRPEGPKRRE